MKRGVFFFLYPYQTAPVQHTISSPLPSVILILLYLLLIVEYNSITHARSYLYYTNKSISNKNCLFLSRQELFALIFHLQ